MTCSRKSRIALSALLLSLIVSISAQAGPQAARRQLYQLEQRSWIEYISRFPDGTAPSSFDVTFYHLNVDIGITSPHIQGNVLCEFKAIENDLQSITLDLHRALAADSVSGSIDHYHQADDTIHIALDRTYQSPQRGTSRTNTYQRNYGAVGQEAPLVGAADVVNTFYIGN